MAEQFNGTLPKVLPRDIPATRQRLEQNVGEVERTFAKAGAPLPADEQEMLKSARAMPDQDAIGVIQEVLDRHVLATVGLDDEAWFTVNQASPDPSTRPLVQYRWTTYLVKVMSDARTTAPLAVRSVQALSTLSDKNQAQGEACAEQPRDWAHWLLMRMPDSPDFSPMLSGKEVEYFVVQLCSLDAGVRAAEITFYLAGGQVSQGHYGSTFMVFKPKSAG